MCQRSIPRDAWEVINGELWVVTKALYVGHFLYMYMLMYMYTYMLMYVKTYVYGCAKTGVLVALLRSTSNPSPLRGESGVGSWALRAVPFGSCRSLQVSYVSCCLDSICTRF